MATVGVFWGLRAGSVLPYFADKTKVPALPHAEPSDPSLSPGRADPSALCSSQWTCANC